MTSAIDINEFMRRELNCQREMVERVVCAERGSVPVADYKDWLAWRDEGFRCRATTKNGTRCKRIALTQEEMDWGCLDEYVPGVDDRCIQHDITPREERIDVAAMEADEWWERRRPRRQKFVTWLMDQGYA